MDQLETSHWAQLFFRTFRAYSVLVSVIRSGDRHCVHGVFIKHTSSSSDVLIFDANADLGLSGQALSLRIARQYLNLRTDLFRVFSETAEFPYEILS